jgi:hypothetical protein
VFVVTKGEGAVTSEEILALQNLYDQSIITNHLQAINNTTGEKYHILIQFQFFDGGTQEEAEKKNKEVRKQLGMTVHGTFCSYSSDADFEAKYKAMDGNKNPKTIGGFTDKYRDIYMRGSLATWREKLHEGFHLLGGKDDINAVGIMSYSNSGVYGIGPGVIKENVEEALNNLMQMEVEILRFDKQGKILEEKGKGETFTVTEKPIHKMGRGSGMGGLYLDNVKE